LARHYEEDASSKSQAGRMSHTRRGIETRPVEAKATTSTPRAAAVSEAAAQFADVLAAPQPPPPPSPAAAAPQPDPKKLAQQVAALAKLKMEPHHALLQKVRAQPRELHDPQLRGSLPLGAVGDALHEAIMCTEAAAENASPEQRIKLVEAADWLYALCDRSSDSLTHQLLQWGRECVARHDLLRFAAMATAVNHAVAQTVDLEAAATPYHLRADRDSMSSPSAGANSEDDIAGAPSSGRASGARAPVEKVRWALNIACARSVLVGSHARVMCIGVPLMKW